MSELLLQHMNREAAAIGSFIELLDQEAQAMTDGNFATLPELAERKSQQADAIVQLRSQREAEQLAQGFAPDRSGVEAAVSIGGKALHKAWSELQQRAAQARQSNHRNGVMIHTHLEFTRQSIAFLQATGKPLYGPNGTHHSGATQGSSLGLG